MLLWFPAFEEYQNQAGESIPVAEGDASFQISGFPQLTTSLRAKETYNLRTYPPKLKRRSSSVTTETPIRSKMGSSLSPSSSCVCDETLKKYRRCEFWPFIFCFIFSLHPWTLACSQPFPRRLRNCLEERTKHVEFGRRGAMDIMSIEVMAMAACTNNLARGRKTRSTSSSNCCVFQMLFSAPL